MTCAFRIVRLDAIAIAFFVSNVTIVRASRPTGSPRRSTVFDETVGWAAAVRCFARRDPIKRPRHVARPPRMKTLTWTAVVADADRRTRCDRNGRRRVRRAERTGAGAKPRDRVPAACEFRGDTANPFPATVVVRRVYARRPRDAAILRVLLCCSAALHCTAHTASLLAIPSPSRLRPRRRVPFVRKRLHTLVFSSKKKTVKCVVKRNSFETFLLDIVYVFFKPPPPIHK